MNDKIEPSKTNRFSNPSKPITAEQEGNDHFETLKAKVEHDTALINAAATLASRPVEIHHVGPPEEAEQPMLPPVPGSELPPPTA